MSGNKKHADNVQSIEWQPTGFNSPTLIFDIDGTLIKEGETLDNANPFRNNHDAGSDDNNEKEQKRTLLKYLKALVEYGYGIVFITGNDFKKQKPRVLDPIMREGLEKSVMCFSDGGSRLFVYDPDAADYCEDIDYSVNNHIEVDRKEWILEQFNLSIRDFVRNNPTLCRPDILLHDRTMDYVDLLIYPLRPSFCRSIDFIKFSRQVRLTVKESRVVSPFQLLERIPNALIIRLMGDYADADAHRLQNSLHDIFDMPEYAHISRPEAEVRGGLDYTSQIALKPFKRNNLRLQFLEMFRERFKESPYGDEFSVLLGGRSTIDIQVKGVDKEKAVRYLVEKWRLDPGQMIYFGDEFFLYGNDLKVAEMDEVVRPAMIVHVGEARDTLTGLKYRKGFLLDGNGPRGTANYLEFLLNEKLNK